MDISEAQSTETFTALRQAWDSLVERCTPATLFQTWEWNDAWWQAFGAGKQLRLLQVHDRGELVGLAPLCVSCYPGTPLRRLRFLGTGVSDYLDLLACDDRGPEVCSVILQYLAGSSAYDLIDWQELRPSAVLRETVHRHPEVVPPAYQVAWRDQELCVAWRCPRHGSTMSRNLGRPRGGSSAIISVCSTGDGSKMDLRLAKPEELSGVMTALIDLHGQQWRTRGLPGHLVSRQAHAFHRRVAEHLEARGWLRLHMAALEGRVVAVEYAFCFRQRYYLYLAGLDPEWYPYRLGTVLTGEAIRQAMAEGCVAVDFLRGNEAYKRAWRPTEARLNRRLVLVRPTSLRSRAALWIDRLRPPLAARLHP